VKTNWKGVLWFLAITFGITWAAEFTLIAMGVRFDGSLERTYVGQLVVLAAMWVPTLAAVITVRFITHEDADRFGLRLGRIRPYLIWMALMPLLFALIYGISWALGLATPDFGMTAFMAMMVRSGADLSDAPPAAVIVPLLFFASAITVPCVNSLVALGEEIGWRGYLLPRLMPLGKPAAYTLTGVIWALWHAPIILIGFAYPGYPVAGILAFIVLVSALNVIENELYLAYGNTTLLAAWIHGLFNSQKLGIWNLIFIGINPLLGGYTGLIGMLVFWGVALIVLRLFAVKPHSATSATQKPAFG
jgi:uncharacterized protein